MMSSDVQWCHSIYCMALSSFNSIKPCTSREVEGGDARQMLGINSRCQIRNQRACDNIYLVVVGQLVAFVLGRSVVGFIGNWCNRGVLFACGSFHFVPATQSAPQQARTGILRDASANTSTTKGCTVQLSHFHSFILDGAIVGGIPSSCSKPILVRSYSVLLLSSQRSSMVSKVGRNSVSNRVDG